MNPGPQDSPLQHFLLGLRRLVSLMVSAGVGTPCIWEVLEPACLARQGDTLFPSQTTGASQSNFIFISYFYFLVGSFQQLWVRWAPPSSLHPASWPKPQILDRSSHGCLCGLGTGPCFWLVHSSRWCGGVTPSLLTLGAALGQWVVAGVYLSV